jgi:hypothetical protein
MHVRTHRWRYEQTGSLADGWPDRQTDRHIHRRTDRWTDGKTEQHRDRRTEISTLGETDRNTEGHSCIGT